MWCRHTVLALVGCSHSRCRNEWLQMLYKVNQNVITIFVYHLKKLPICCTVVLQRYSFVCSRIVQTYLVHNSHRLSLALEPSCPQYTPSRRWKPHRSYTDWESVEKTRDQGILHQFFNRAPWQNTWSYMKLEPQVFNIQLSNCVNVQRALHQAVITQH